MPKSSVAGNAVVQRGFLMVVPALLKIKPNDSLLEILMNEDACDLVDYDRSEPAEHSLSPKRGTFKQVVA